MGEFPCPPLPAADLAHVLQHTRELWNEVRGQSVFITGGTGFFGMWLLESFVHANESLGLGAHATVLTRDSAAFARKAPHLAGRSDLSFVVGDVRTFAYPAGKFAYVIHAATEASAKLNEEQPDKTLEVIVDGTRRVLAFAAQAGVRKLLLTSSGAVYGRQPSELTHVPEDYPGAPDPLLPASAYGEGKRVAEHLCAVHARRHGYEVKIARCFAFVGPHLPIDGTFAIGSFIGDALRAAPIRIDGDGTPFRSYLYSADLAIWLWTILLKAQPARAFNVGSEEAISIAEVADVVRTVLRQPIPIGLLSAPSAGRSSSRYVPATRRAESELGLRALVSLADGVSRTAAWHSHWKRS